MNIVEEVADGGNLEQGGGHASAAQPYHGNVEDVSVSVPVPDYDGPFSHWAQMIQAEQYQQLVTLLGIEYFKGHDDPRMRAARGFLFIHQLTLSEFLARARALKYNAEG